MITCTIRPYYYHTCGVKGAMEAGISSGEESSEDEESTFYGFDTILKER